MAADYRQLVETRSGMILFAQAVREHWPMDPADFEAAIAAMQRIAGEGRGRVSLRAEMTLAEVAKIGPNRPRARPRGCA